MDRKSPMFRRGSRLVSVRGFTLMELMITVGIIAVLVSILIPVIGKARQAAQTASTRSLLNNLEASILEYKTTFGAYPGPLPDTAPTTLTVGLPFTGGSIGYLQMVGGGVVTAGWPQGYKTLPIGAGAVPAATNVTVNGVTPTTYEAITGTNNLVLGLVGGMRNEGNSNPKYDPSYIGRGPFNFGSARTNGSFYDGTKDLSWRDTTSGKTGKFQFEGGAVSNDCDIPSFVDRYSMPMPILYLRAQPGIPAKKVTATDTNPTVVEYNNAAGQAPGRPYNLAHILPYTSSQIGYPAQVQPGSKNYLLPGGGTGMHGLYFISKDGTPNWTTPAGDASLRYPYEANQYLTDPNNPGQPRKKDEFILISAGPDRIFGTADDITNFGDVKP